MKQFDERWFSQPARRRPQGDAGASVEDFDAAGAESSLKPEVMQLRTLKNIRSPELDLLHSEQRREKLTGLDPLRFPLLVTAQNPGVQAIQSDRNTL
ncbi:hypothetical protein [Oricola sp.]|uniref:hypothetical protein n=1 Tax=Oricola sp. TaxID=1979950 RepID=UPI003BAC4090